MKTPLFTIGLCLFIANAFSQDSRYASLEEQGWHVTILEEPPDLKDTDIGTLSYLITLDENGKVQHIKVLRSNFSARTEKLWRKKILDTGFVCTKGNQPASKRVRGTLLITRETCNKEVAVDF